MGFKKLMIVAVAVMAALSFQACKKNKSDDKYTASPTIPGTLRFDAPVFVAKGDVLNLVPRGLQADTIDVGYYWTASPLTKTKDTTKFVTDPRTMTGAYKLTVRDTICTATLTCTAFAKGYSNKSYSRTITVVDPSMNGSILFDGIEINARKFKDERDGKSYFYKKIGDREWFSRNLAWKGAGLSFQNCEVMDAIYGRYYTWTEAQTACPEGWRVPSDEDWFSLAQAAEYKGETKDGSFMGIAGALMVNAYFNNTRMWEYCPEVKITNKAGFSAIPTGYGTKASSDSFTGDFEYAVYWSSESVATEGEESTGVYRMIYWQKPDVIRAAVDKTNFIAPVRCVRDAASEETTN